MTTDSAASETAPLRAAIYCRISRDRDGSAKGVDRQERDCRALAARLGWQVVGVYIDNDISAYSGKRRPQYEALMKAVDRDHIGAIVAWHPDRLHRRTIELEAFIDAVQTHRVQIQTVTAGNYDLTTPDGRMIAKMLGAAAQREVEHTKQKIKRQKEQAVEQGRYRGGRRPYGYEKDGVTVAEREARVIRECTEAILAGRSFIALARELTEAGVVSSTGTPFTNTSLRDVLLRPRNAGLMSRSTPGRAGFAILGPASWGAIVDEDQWRALYNLISDPSRRTRSGSNELKWIGTKTYRCGVPGCDSTMRPVTRTEEKAGQRRRRYAYRCEASSHITITAVKTDAFVKQVVAEVLRDPRLVAALTAREDSALGTDRDRRRILMLSLEQTEQEYYEDKINARQLKGKTDRIEAEIAEIDARLAVGMQLAATNPVFLAADPAGAFLRAPVDVQRAVLRETLRVEILPASGPGQGWTEDRLRITRSIEKESDD